MSKKNRDGHNRWRNIVVAFRVSAEENENINMMVRLSGLTKQEYITKRLENKDVVVVGNPRVYKGLRNILADIKEKLEVIEQRQLTPDDELHETIRTVSKTLDEMRKEKDL
ncbi:MAG: hypothetical protein WDA06_07845 [Phenylobacterium sp.]|jgi:2-succinyl-5-enolpyruvyl-6-hydroxy-3-cyclohexene-1-carboxylate synthase